MYYWFPKMSGRLMNETLGKIHFWLFFIGFNGTFLPMHWLGMLGMPREVATYDPQFTFWNRFESVSSYLMTLRDPDLLRQRHLEHSQREALRPEPVGRAHARVADSVAAALLQLQAHPDGLRPPYDFSQPLPYQGLDEELTDSPPPVACGSALMTAAAIGARRTTATTSTSSTSRRASCGFRGSCSS